MAVCSGAGAGLGLGAAVAVAAVSSAGFMAGACLGLGRDVAVVLRLLDVLRLDEPLCDAQPASAMAMMHAVRMCFMVVRYF